MKILLVIGISLLLHFSIYLYVNKADDKTNELIKNKYKSTNSKITYVNIKAPKNTETKITNQHSNTKKALGQKPKIKPKKKIDAKKQPKKVVKKQLKKEIKKISKKPTIKKVIPKKKILKKVRKPIAKPIEKVEKIDRTTQTYLDLYGDDFENFSKETKVYLIKNIKDIASITRIFLEYPYMSIQAGQSGVSVVEFILYPNGTISDLKIIKTSKYFLLDDNTKETIEAAYSDYPRPSKPTVIRIYVKYILN